MQFAKTRTKLWRFGAVHANCRGLWNHGQYYYKYGKNNYYWTGDKMVEHAVHVARITTGLVIRW